MRLRPTVRNARRRREIRTDGQRIIVQVLNEGTHVDSKESVGRVIGSVVCVEYERSYRESDWVCEVN